MSEFAIILLQVARLMGIEGTPPAPTVVHLPPLYFVAKACNGRTPCRVRGLYADDYVIMLDDTLQPAQAASVYAHEACHYLQHRRAGNSKIAAQNGSQRERECYAVQNQWKLDNTSSIEPHLPPALPHFGGKDVTH